MYLAKKIHRSSMLAVLAGLALGLLPGFVSAADYYVTPNGAGSTNGVNWHQAMSNVQAAFNLATNNGDKIFLQWGAYSNAAQIAMSNAAGLTVYGGCKGGAGAGSNDFSGTNSMLTRSGGTTRILFGCNSTATVAGVTVSGGCFTNGANNGAGLLLTNCVVTLTNCVVRDNTNTCTATTFGGGIYAAGGSLTLLDCAFYNNALQNSAGAYGYGGGLAVSNCPVIARGSGTVFSNNIALCSSFYAQYGGAIFATNSALTLENALLIGNRAASGGNGNGFGGAIYHMGVGMAASIANCCFVSNRATMGGNAGAYGGAVYFGGSTGVIANCAFTNNYAGGGSVASHHGGCIYATGLQSLQLVSNAFYGNFLTPTVDLRGATLAAINCASVLVDYCSIDGSGLTPGTAPDQVFISGGGNARLLETGVRNNAAGGGITFLGAGASLTMSNCLVAFNNGNGLTVTNGRASLFDCLLAQNVGDGVLMAAGTVTVANCTLADNGGWGLNRAAGTGTVVNSIAWGNGYGGISSNGNVWVDYSCLQAPASGGVSNFYNDPLFVNVPGCYYLSVSGLTGQAASSPCLDRGNDTAANLGLTNRTTCTSGTNDSGVADLGYHYTNGVAGSSILTVSNCYVDAASGTDTNNGLSWAAAWKTLTYALSNVAAKATINAAAGTYNAGSGEVFPLTVRMPHLTLAASNGNPALTVLDNAGTNGQRVLQAQGKGALVLRGLTFRGGCFTNGENYGAGLKLEGCAVTLTNCVVRDNTNTCTASSFGGGIYAAGGSLTLLDCAFYNNTVQSAGAYCYGGGLAAINCWVTARGSGVIFSNNMANTASAYAQYGGALYATNSALTVENAVLVGNRAACGLNGPGLGGAIYHVGVGMAAAFSGCRLMDNYTTGWGSGGAGYGGALYLGGATGVIANCVFSNNSTFGGSSWIQGGAVYAVGLQSLQVVSNLFQGNRVSGGGNNGGSLYIGGCSNTLVDYCSIDGSGLAAGTAPDQVFITGGGSARMIGTSVRNNAAGGGITFTGAVASLTMSNCLATGNSGHGLTVTNARASLFDCLLSQNLGDGVLMAVGGTVTVANCTLAYNGGWGLNRAAGTGTVVNSIAWGNGGGGIASNANVWVDYSCLQAPASGGASNFYDDPLFANVRDCYYLSVSGLTGQAASSPCLDRGNDTAANLGLTNRTTCTSGTNDSGVADLGYHYTNGVPGSSILTITNCYVDAVGGNDTNNGATWGTAWKTLTYAFSNVTANATVNAATGTYNAGSGEVFPLTVRMAGLTLAASNGNPALTVLDNAGTNGQRVLQAQAKGALLLRGLTFRGGCFTNGENYGAGLKLDGCVATLTNCVVRDNTNFCTTGSFGGGIYAGGGSLTLADCAFYNNSMWCSAVIPTYGGGIAAANCPLTVRGSACIFSNNAVYCTSYGGSCGGAIFATNSALTLENAALIANWANNGGNGSAYGGAIYHVGAGMAAAFSGCRFAGNYATASGTINNNFGGAVYLGVATGVIASCVFTNNYAGGGTYFQRGAAVYAAGLLSLQAVSNVFRGNRLVAGGQNNGGALCLIGCSNSLVSCCTLDSRGTNAGAEHLYATNCASLAMAGSAVQNNSAYRGIYFVGPAAASLALTNCLVANNGGDGLLMSAGPATFVNCTFANNAGWGIARPTAAGMTVKNSIFWGNSYGGIGHNQNLTLTYTDAQDEWASALGAGNFSADPLFADPASGDYHEQGVEGSYHNGAWAPDARNSPCLDAGDPASDWSLETKPCGNRINVGAYGNTAEATRSLPKVGTVLRVW